MAYFTPEPLPGRLLRHAECFSDLRPTVARLSRLADRLKHCLLERGLRSAALAQSLKWTHLPVSERPQAQVVPVADDAHAW